MGLLKGWLYFFLWYSSILAGYAGLFCPLLPVLLVSNKLYRYCTDIFFTFWQLYPTILLELLCGCDLQITGDKILTNQTSILIMNHRTRTDWNFVWPTIHYALEGKQRYKHPLKFILKDIVRHIPGPGWVMQLACFIYIKRNWQWDRTTLRNTLNYFNSISTSYKYCLLVFPEGTDFTGDTKAISDRYADKMNLPRYEHVLHPRTTGFTFVTHYLLERNALDAVYDLTLIYPDVVPQNERVLLSGHFPRRIIVHVTRYARGDLPKSERDLGDFLVARWTHKDQVIGEYAQSGRLNILMNNDVDDQKNQSHIRDGQLLAALMFWTLLPPVVLYAFVFVAWFRYMVLAHTVLMLVVNYVSDGFQRFEIALYNAKKKLLKYFYN